MKDVKRFLKSKVIRPYLQVPKIKIQPILAREGKPSVDVAEVAAMAGDNVIFNDLVCIKSTEHWNQVVSNLPDDVDAIIISS